MWKFVVDVRSAVGLPLHARNDHGLPSTRVQIDFSPSVDFKESIPLLSRSTAIIYETSSPTWNTKFVIKSSDYDRLEGFVFVTLYDDLETQLDQFSIPLKFFDICRPISMEVLLLQGEATFYLTMYLDTESGITDPLDKLVDLGIKWVEVEPLPQAANYFSLLIAKVGLPIGSKPPFIKCDTRDDQSFSRGFY